VESYEKTSVLVVGGSLVGLSAALFLAWRGVSTILVETHTGSHPHPRAIGYTPRTLELLREVGLEAKIPPIPTGFRLRRARVESLAGTWFEESPWTPEEHDGPAVEYSPCSGAAIAQDRLETILRDEVRSLGADLRLGTSLVRFEQDAAGVTATLREPNGRESTLRADYMIAADGNRSSVRDALGIARKGRGHMRTVRSVLFRAPLDAYLEKGISQFEIDQPDLKAFLTTYRDGRWVLMFTDDAERDEPSLITAVQKAIGRTDLDIEIITTGRWELTGLVADRFSSGRAFLAGDAAHTLPPTRGGFGANTGIHDVHNLAWKLDAVLSGRSTPRLLETYDAERRPVAWVRLEQTFARPDYAKHAEGFASGVTLLDESAIELGQLYRSTAVIGATADLPVAARPDEWAGQPGTRAPHLWVTRKDARASTLDLFGRGWVLLAEDARWTTAASQVGILGLRTGSDFAPLDLDAFRRAFGISESGASLIRPDGYVAWRAAEMPADPQTFLAAALASAAA
jgi:2-polyprenyl-6-methoxyphenol hydroxylase-like FAD-dependent oxidoreductase